MPNNRHNGNNRRKGNNRRRDKPEWTIMVYLAGDNNLTANCISVLQQLEAVEYSSDVCVLACFDSNTPWPKGSRYLAINCRRRRVDNGLDWEIHNDLIPPEDRDHEFIPPDFCPTESSTRVRGRHKRTGVAEGLRRFINWSMKNHNSEKYMLILYGHGPVVASQTFLARENPRSSLRFKDLRNVLKPHFGPQRKLDILACQNCVMNGIETAYELRGQVKYMVGSQGLVLAAGWPYREIIGAIVEKPSEETSEIARKLLKACARHLIDFAVMDRSSEQSVCDLTQFQGPNDITPAVRKLVRALEKGLDFQSPNGRLAVRYPVICDAIKLARLEAQAYWQETFVDLYDFCERLLKKCNEAARAHNDLLKQLGPPSKLEWTFRRTPLLKLLRVIIGCCIDVMKKIEAMVPVSYYIGPELQYSHGLSIYFPWTLQGEPYSFVRVKHDYILTTAFETYQEYDFVRVSGWSKFLKAFYIATLRRVRRSNRDFELRDVSESLDYGLVHESIKAPSEILTGSLQKSDSSTGTEEYGLVSQVKNYPRRNYLSPADCPRRVEEAGRQRSGSDKFRDRESPPVSYLGWNISGVVAQVIAKPRRASKNGRQNRPRTPVPPIVPKRQKAGAGAAASRSRDD